MIPKSNIAIFPGTFNPFTIGHASIVQRGLTIFSKVIIAVGVNICKPEEENSARVQDVQKLYENDSRVEVVSHCGLTADLVREKGACAIIRGVRSSTDFEYERTLADVNRRLCGVETVLLYALPEMECISSSMVRELQHFGADISQFLPEKH